MAKPLEMLVVHGYTDIQDLLTFVLEAHFSANVFTASDEQEALNLIKQHGRFNSVVADKQFLLAQEGALLNELKGHQSPLVIMTSQDLSADLKALSWGHRLHKPFSESDILNVVAKALDCKDLSGEFFPARLELLERIRTILAPVFIRIGDEKFVKVAHEASTFDRTQVERFRAKGVTHLYIERENVPRFLEAFKKEVFSELAWESTLEIETFDSLSLCTETLWNLTHQLGWSQDVLELTQLQIQRALALTSSLPMTEKVLYHFQKIERFGYSDHCTLTLFLCIGMGNALGLNNDINIRKLTFASLFHDSSLMDHQFDKKRKLIQKIRKKESMNQKDVQDVFAHSAKAAELCRSWDFCPPGVDQLIYQHHSYPKEYGFPMGLDAHEFDMLSALFIVCEDFVDYFVESRGNLSFDEYRKIRSSYFSEPPFSEIIAKFIGAKNRN